ncbi:17.0 kDa class II heat shock protein-like [Curcuma longa]|uniref:17.0 kDa class II heat shock protein-like n=1 Tax=Curcuma longa TaxID=136217 RepID=UPI003D9F1524
MDVRVFGLENPVMSTLHHLMNVPDEMEKGMGAPTRAYVQDARAMASTPADIKELPSAYAFIVDMPGVKPVDIKVQVEDDRVLVIGGERTRGSPGEEDGWKYLRMERRVGKFMRKFALPDNANVDAITAVCQNGLLTVTVQKLPPAEPKKPKTVEVRVS